MSSFTFKTELIKADDSSATGIYVPTDIVEKLDSKKRIPVQVKIDSVVYQSTIVRMGGRYLVPVNKSIRDQLNKYGGEMVDVELEKDMSKREVTIPTVLHSALQKEGLLKSFKSLSFTNQKEMVNSIIDAKADETRQRRMEKIIKQLKN